VTGARYRPGWVVGAAVAVGYWWTWFCGARRWLLATVVLLSGLLTSFAAALTWFAVSFDRCFTF
jgi:hypothetical protein